MIGPRVRLLGVVVAAVLLVGCGGEEIDPPTSAPSASRSDTRTAGAAALAARLGPALSATGRGAALRLAAPDPSSRRAVAALHANARALRLTTLSFRYVEEDASAPPARVVTAYGGRAWTATVAAAYRIAGLDRRRTTLETRLVLVTTPDGVRLAASGGGSERGALWLDGPVRVARAGDALVVAASASPRRYLTLARQAVVDVRRVLAGWRGALVVEVPGSERRLDSLLGADPGEYHAIAAVTTTVDGSTRAGTPSHVYLNPAVFDRLGPRGSQVVLSHEATHVATDASLTAMPTWLLEGFADFVALDHAGIPVGTAAGQILARVRRDGPPSSLPSSRDLDPSAPGLGATYEEAWTACRYLGATYGESRMVAFYDAVRRGASTREAFRRVLGTSQDDFVRGWRADLVREAGS